LRLCFFALLLLLSACASGPAGKSRVQGLASQEVISGEARIRAKAHTDLGFEYYAQNQFGTALQEAKVAIKFDSSYTPAYNLLALVSVSLGDNISAEEAFQKAFQLSPGDPEIANNFGYFLCQTKREQRAIPYFDTALQNPLYPTPLMALSNAAECSLRIGDAKGAQGYLKRALSLNPDSPRALLLMAELKYSQKQYDEARYFITEAHRNADPTAASAWLGLRIARHAGRREDEARYQSQLRKKFPDSEEYRKLTQGASE
jgi:type IV pilus assembly protein PilF